MSAILNESRSCLSRASSAHASSIPLDPTSNSIARRPSFFHHFFPILFEASRSVVAATTAWLVVITRHSFVNTRPTMLIPIARQSFVSACLALSCFCLIALYKLMTWLVPNCIPVGRGADLASYANGSPLDECAGKRALSISKALGILSKTSIGKESFLINQREPRSALVNSPFVCCACLQDAREAWIRQCMRDQLLGSTWRLLYR
jgi:hypothetical protein